MRFDTLNKKPKLYAVIIPIAIAAAIIALLISGGAEKNAVPICIVVIACLLSITALLISAFIGQLRYNPYSYNTIYYVGFALFLLSIAVMQIILLIGLIRHPETRSASSILFNLLNSAWNYMLFSSPFLLVFSVALCVSNISLLIHERKRFVNVLGILLSFVIVGGWLLLFRIDNYASGSQTQVMFHDMFVNLLAAVYLYIECMLIGTIIANLIVVRYEPEKDKDFIIILGCGLRPDGSPTPLLRGRIDRALAFSEKQKAETGKEPVFVTSGGQGPGEVNSESLAMKRYLIEKGVPEDRIIEEDRSTSTFENMQFSKEKIVAANSAAKIAFSTTNYHVFRSGLFARRVKMRAVGMGAKTKWYFWPNAAVREFLGLLTEHRVKQAIILGSMIVFYVVLTILVYSVV